MHDEPVTGQSGAEEPEWGECLTSLFSALSTPSTLSGKFDLLREYMPPDKFYPDGKPILDDELMPAAMKWALLLEQRDGDRIVGQTRTLYGEKLSTVWLGLDHNFSRVGPPLIFETMLFAPDDDKGARRAYILALAKGTVTLDQEALAETRRAYTEKHYPHDQLQLRHSTRAQAEDAHERLRLQCLIPPRWRRFILGRVGGDPTWLDYDDEVTEWWY